jgi:hypothetical protein
MEFNFKNKVDKDKVFIVNRNKLEKRLDPFYYIPSLVALEEKLKELKPLALRHYVKSIASGSTPKTTEYDKYYSDKENGIPFLRVQNLSPTGILDAKKVKYINHTTHENYLKRSQVEEGDLLVKITGVGRMAVASVAPYGFVGNTNQHMVVIKTGSKEASEVLAAYLNTDIAEALASRRATGGTRPALDYPALLSIPIINSDEILRINKKAINSKQEKEKQAKELLGSIDRYLLDELGITLPLKSNTLSSRIFEIKYTELTGSRFDPGLYNNHTKALKQAIEDSKFKSVPLKELIIQSNAGDWGSESVEDNERLKACLVIRATEFDNDFNLKLDNSRVKYRSISRDKLKKINIQEQDILIEKSGGSPYQPVGRVAILRSDILRNNTICYSNFIHKITLNKSLINPEYAFAYLKTMHNIKLTQSMQSQTDGIRNLIMSNYFNQSIVLPIKTDGSIDMDKQNEIALKISGMRAKAEKLQVGAIASVNDAQKEIEKIILV